jgi:DNA-binding GntR family transcriptional regulator
MFERKPLRTDVGTEILGRVIDGRLPSGTRINESHLALELGISRTPLREAMLCLTTEGVLVSDMGRGFRVPPLAGREIGDLLDALAVTLPASVRQGPDNPGNDLKAHIEAGNLIGRARMHADDPGALCEHLYGFLSGLCRQCSNEVMQGQCRWLLRKSLRYLFEAQTRGWTAATLLDDLDASLGRLRQGDRPGAAEVLARILRELGSDLAQRFPAEVGGQA